MAKNLTQKIIAAHLVEESASECAIRIDQTLTQDATGTMAYLEFEAIGLERVRTELSVSYVDHNTLQSGFENADDHRFLQDIARRYGIKFSRPGNGICHQVHLERFGVPGKTLLGSDSHTPTGGGIGMLAIGAGGLDVAAAMAGMPFSIPKPKVVGVQLTGQLKPWVSAKDVILEVLRRCTVKGGVGRIFEYCGPGVASLSVPERATITNMGAELGATSSIFPSDEITRQFLKAQGRASDWVELKADPVASYDETIAIDLSQLVPLAACPHMPDNVKPVAELKGLKVDQVLIGSCTNSSLKDLMLVAEVLKDRKLHSEVSLGIAPGSRQVLKMLADSGHLGYLIAAGARLMENACGPCIGMGQSPKTAAVSLRTFNRNFKGRSGTADAGVYLVSPEVAVAAAVTGYITDPRELGEFPRFELPASFLIDDSMILEPAPAGTAVEITRGPNIKALPKRSALEDEVTAKVLLKCEDNITTDDIMPAGAKILPLRSNIEAISRHVFAGIDSSFAERALAAGSGVIVARDNYGQGSSREHAALAPMYLGVKAVLAGELVITTAKGQQLKGEVRLSQREAAILLAGGLLNFIKNSVEA
ncbi:MAG: Homoaconitase large subunit [Deltaproteobacteria bacterium ADurb.Bin510]|nr:MAG: Homoaconitase large subunit [Deltaproteobacteria bacterium ADurb.Bin510]